MILVGVSSTLGDMEEIEAVASLVNFEPLNISQI